jgi:hypothetical protein
VLFAFHAVLRTTDIRRNSSAARSNAGKEHDMAEHDVQTVEAEVPAEAGSDLAGRPRWKRALKRVLIGLASLIGALVVLGVLLYEFGGMSGSVHPELFAQYDRMVASGQAPPIEKRFVIPIPGCVCHSTDPVQTAKHRVYRMSECGQCHNGGETAQEAPPR